MSTIEQHYDGFQVSLDDISSQYYVRGQPNELQAEVDLYNNAPGIVAGLIKQDATIDERVGVADWLGTVKWGTIERKEAGDSQYEFDTGASTINVKHSLSTVASYAASGTAPDFKGAINVQGDEVKGADILVPDPMFSETHHLPDAVVTPAYQRLCESLVGKTNDAVFKGRAEGEVMFAGARGSKSGHDLWQVNYKFKVSINATNLTIGDITGINKKGHEFLWVVFEDEEDDTAKKLVKRPKYAYVERVSNPTDFGQLGIGT